MYGVVKLPSCQDHVQITPNPGFKPFCVSEGLSVNQKSVNKKGVTKNNILFTNNLLASYKIVSQRELSRK
jgi:hypothetical protein